MNKKGALSDLLYNFVYVIGILVIALGFSLLFTVQTKAAVKNVVEVYSEDISASTEFRTVLMMPTDVDGRTVADLIVMARNDACVVQNKPGGLCANVQNVVNSYMNGAYWDRVWKLEIVYPGRKVMKIDRVGMTPFDTVLKAFDLLEEESTQVFLPSSLGDIELRFSVK